MAEIAVSFAVERMGDLLIHKAMFWKRVHDEVDRLMAELTRMQWFLKDADARQHEDGRIRHLVSEIRDLAYQAEDAIDLYISGVVMPGKTKLFPWRIFRKMWNCNKMGKQIEGIQMKLQDIRMSLVTYGINNSMGEATTSAGRMLQKLRYLSPLVNENIVVGLQGDTDELVRQLVGGDERRRVVSVVGMGGIGKTTLAKKVYNDSRVLGHFPSYRAWVYVSEDCRPRDVFQQILNRLPFTPTEAERSKIKEFQENELGDFLHEYLRGKKFLVVLDDIWKSEDWKCVARAFPKENHGSRLLLTTRNTEVALQADARGAPHRMQVLSDGESWKLFCRTAFPEERESDIETCPPGLEEIGEKMVKKCGGLPLAIVVLGGLLSLKPPSPTAWENVLSNLEAHFAGANGVDAVLSLSYLDLPPNLKSCFLYMGLFPEDQVIPKRQLLQLWMAEGFVGQEEDGQRREGRAEEYLNQLINRNLVQAAKVSMNERVTTCRIHDLVRDLCIKKAKELNFFKIPQSSSTSSPTSSRRFGVYHEYMDSWYASTPYIRSLLFFNRQRLAFNFSDDHFKLLRVLDLGDVCLTTTIGLRELIHLRYLRLKGETNWNSLQPSVRNFWGSRRPNYLCLPTSLQTLILEEPSDSAFIYLQSLGREVQKLENLQHLSLSPNSVGERHEVLRIERLRNLQTLFWISSGDWLQNDTSELASLRKLKIQVEFRDREEEEAATQLSNSIAKCENLRSLCLRSLYLKTMYGYCGGEQIPCLVMNSWLRLTKLEMAGLIGKLPEAHEFPPSLTQLTLEGTELGNECMVILENLPKLLTLRLRRDAFTEEVQVLKDGFPQLTNLLLSKCESRLHIHKGGMPKLTRLQSYDSSVIQGIGRLLNLRKVDIEYGYGAKIHYMPNNLPSPSQWHEIRSKNEEGRIIYSYVRK